MEQGEEKGKKKFYFAGSYSCWVEKKKKRRSKRDGEAEKKSMSGGILLQAVRGM